MKLVLLFRGRANSAFLQWRLIQLLGSIPNNSIHREVLIWFDFDLIWFDLFCSCLAELSWFFSSMDEPIQLFFNGDSFNYLVQFLAIQFTGKHSFGLVL